jgi:ribosomal protein S27AE
MSEEAIDRERMLRRLFRLPYLGLFKKEETYSGPPKTENITKIKHGKCPKCGSLLHKKESRLICKTCGFKIKRMLVR